MLVLIELRTFPLEGLEGSSSSGSCVSKEQTVFGDTKVYRLCSKVRQRGRSEPSLSMCQSGYAG